MCDDLMITLSYFFHFPPFTTQAKKNVDTCKYMAGIDYGVGILSPPTRILITRSIWKRMRVVQQAFVMPFLYQAPDNYHVGFYSPVSEGARKTLVIRNNIRFSYLVCESGESIAYMKMPSCGFPRNRFACRVHEYARVIRECLPGAAAHSAFGVVVYTSVDGWRLSVMLVIDDVMTRLRIRTCSFSLVYPEPILELVAKLAASVAATAPIADVGIFAPDVNNVFTHWRVFRHVESFREIALLVAAIDVSSVTRVRRLTKTRSSPLLNRINLGLVVRIFSSLLITTAVVAFCIWSQSRSGLHFPSTSSKLLFWTATMSTAVKCPTSARPVNCASQRYALRGTFQVIVE